MSVLREADEQAWDLIIVGAGTSGLAAAAFAGQRSNRVLLVDAAPTIGGTLLVAFGQLSAAGTKLQVAKGIADSPERHFAEALRISRGTIDAELARLAIFNAGSTFDWQMDNGFDVLPECPSIDSAHEPYEVARYYWGKDLGKSILAVLEKVVRVNEAQGRLSIMTGTRVERLLQDASGAVQGVELLKTDGARRRCRARNVVLACGGYAANPEMFQRLSGHPLYVKSAYSYAQGAGLDLGVAAGGYLRGHDKYLSNFGWLLEDDRFPSAVIGRANTAPNSRPPWEIYVNVHARRFIREDEPSVDVREHRLLEQPQLRYWIIFDQHIFDKAPPIVHGWTREQINEAFNVRFPFRKAATLDALARDIGVDAATLVKTVAAYNAGQASARDEFGRVHMPAPIANGPFYAIRQQGGSVTSTVGLAVNGELQVIRQDGTPIRGLYAAGEILGSGQLQGNAFVGGMMATPALVFGRLLGERLTQAS